MAQAAPRKATLQQRRSCCSLGARCLDVFNFSLHFTLVNSMMPLVMLDTPPRDKRPHTNAHVHVQTLWYKVGHKIERTRTDTKQTHHHTNKRARPDLSCAQHKLTHIDVHTCRPVCRLTSACTCLLVFSPPRLPAASGIRRGRVLRAEFPDGQSVGGFGTRVATASVRGGGRGRGSGAGG